MAADSKEEVCYMMEQLNNLRKENNCDVVICVQGKKFPAHRYLVAAACPFFKTLLLQQEWKVVNPTIYQLNAEIFSKILDYIYTGQIDISSQNAFSLLKGANYLLMDRLQDICIKFLSRKCPLNNICAVLNFALNVLSNKDFVSNLEAQIAENIHEITIYGLHYDIGNFQDIPFESIENIFSRAKRTEYASNRVYCCKFDCESGNVKYIRTLEMRTTICHKCNGNISSHSCSKLLALLVKRWIEKDPTERIKLFPKLLPYVDALTAYKRIWRLVENIATKSNEQGREMPSKEKQIRIYTLSSDQRIKVFETLALKSRWICSGTLNIRASNIKTTIINKKVFYLSFDSVKNENTCWIEDEKDEKRTMYLCPPPISMSEYKLTTVKDIIYVYNSGVNAISAVSADINPRNSNIYAYVESWNKWFPLPCPPKILYHSYFVSLDGMLYLIGGNESDKVNAIDCLNANIIQQYNPRTSLWALTAWDVNLPLYGAICTDGDLIYITCVQKQPEFHHTAELLDSRKNEKRGDKKAMKIADTAVKRIEDPKKDDMIDDCEDSVIVMYVFNTKTNKWTVNNRVVNGKFVPNVSFFNPFDDTVYVLPHFVRDRVLAFDDDYLIEEISLSDEFSINGNGNLEIKDVHCT